MNNLDLEVLKEANWEALFNGAEKLGLNDTDLSSILHIKYKTINGWHNKPDRKLPIAKLDSGDGIFVKAFFDLFINLNSWFVNEDDSKNWLRKPNKLLNNRTPLEFMKNDHFGINRINDYLRSRMGI